MSLNPNVARTDVSASVVPWASVATETLARILEDQHKYVEAAVVYEALAAKRPDDAGRFAERAGRLRAKARRPARRPAS